MIKIVKKSKVSAKKAEKATSKDITLPLTPELKKTRIEELLETGKKNNVLTYEEVIDFSEKNELSETETNALLRQIEKEHIELIMQEELELDKHEDIEAVEKEEEAPRVKLAENFETSLVSEEEDEFSEAEEDDDEAKKKIVRAGTSAQISDGVKCYLRDIGKIPLLNKKTETVISDKIARSKRNQLISFSISFYS